MYSIHVTNSKISVHSDFFDLINNLYKMIYTVLPVCNSISHIHIETIYNNFNLDRFNVLIQNNNLLLVSPENKLIVSKLFPQFVENDFMLNRFLSKNISNANHSIKNTINTDIVKIKSDTNNNNKNIEKRTNINTPVNISSNKYVEKKLPIPNKFSKNRVLWAEAKNKEPVKKLDIKFDEVFEAKKEQERNIRIEKFRNDQRYKQFISAKESYVKITEDIKKGKMSVDLIPPFFIKSFVAIETMDIKKDINFESDENLPREYSVYLDMIESMADSEEVCEPQKQKIYVPPKWNYMNDTEKASYANKYNMTISQFESVMTHENDSDLITNFIGLSDKQNDLEEKIILEKESIIKPSDIVTNSDIDADSEIDTDSDVDSDENNALDNRKKDLPEYVKNY